MKRLFLIVAAFVIATPIVAHAQERMSDSRFVAANRDRWLPHLMKLPLVGDFPAPPRDRVPT